MGTPTRMTVEEFARTPFPETEAYELVEGELVPLASGPLRHGKIGAFLERLADEYFSRNPAGVAAREIDCTTVSGAVRRPDVAIYLHDRDDALDWDKVPLPYPPDIAVEVISPNESLVEARRKVHEYLKAGSKGVWQLDYDGGEVLVTTPVGTRSLRGVSALETPLMPGFAVEVATLLRAGSPPSIPR